MVFELHSAGGLATLETVNLCLQQMGKMKGYGTGPRSLTKSWHTSNLPYQSQLWNCA